MVTVQAVNMRFMRTLGDIMDGYSITTEHRYILNATVITRFARPTGYLAPRARITAERKNGGIFRSLRWPESQRET